MPVLADRASDPRGQRVLLLARRGAILCVVLGMLAACGGGSPAAGRTAEELQRHLATGWVRAWVGPMGTGGSITEVAASSRGFVAVVQRHAGGPTELRFSPDGYAWQGVSLPGMAEATGSGWSCQPRINGVAASESHLVAVGSVCGPFGEAPRSGSPAVWVSSDGIDWTLVDSTPFTDPMCPPPGDECGALGTVVAGPAGLVAGGWTVHELGTVLWHSRDGSAWENLDHPDSDIPVLIVTETTIGLVDGGLVWRRDDDGEWLSSDLGMGSGSTPWIYADPVLTADGVLMAGVAEGISWSQPFLWRSADLLTWERIPDPHWLERIAAWDAGYVALGYADADDPSPVLGLLTSVDGVQWASLPLESGPDDLEPRALAAAGSVVLVAGKDVDRWGPAIWVWSDPAEFLSDS